MALVLLPAAYGRLGCAPRAGGLVPWPELMRIASVGPLGCHIARARSVVSV